METVPYLKIGERRVGPGEPVYIIAEMSANHNQDFDRAVKIVEAARKLARTQLSFKPILLKP